jgi:hypothetical protein
MIYVSWWTTGGSEVTFPVPQLAYVPAVGQLIDLEGLSGEVVQLLPEDERKNLASFKVIEVKHSLDRVDVTVERDIEYVHQQELEAKDATLVHVQCTTSYLLDLLQIVTGDGVFFALDGGGDMRDLIALHASVHTNIGTELAAAVDAIYVYPTWEDAKRRTGNRRCVKHRHAELVSQ